MELDLFRMLHNYFTVVIPVKNEAKNLAVLLPILSNYINDLIIVDGNSTDHSVDIATQFTSRIYFDGGKGKGDALRTAIPHITRPITVFMDADQSHNPADIEKLIYPILTNRADHVSGSRMLGGSDELHGDVNKFMRMIGSDIITLGINYRFNVVLTDSQNGFRAIRTDLLKKLNPVENITSIEQELVLKTLLHGYRIAEVSTHEYMRPFGESKIVLKKVFARYIYSWLKHICSRRSSAKLLSTADDEQWNSFLKEVNDAFGNELLTIYNKNISQIEKKGFVHQPQPELNY